MSADADSSPAPIPAAAPIAGTALGQLRGAWQDGIAVFRGVPFAAPPLAELRFAPPAPVKRWKGVRDATRDGAIAPQTTSRLAALMGDISAPQSEDCLTLTICTPAPDQKRRPVLVWIHGGGYTSGAGSLPWYSGATLAREGDIVVVGLNYRLGALGYAYIPEVGPGNVGLLDKRAALLWIREHIAAFGGDPECVTVAGQSGGAMDIVNLLATRSGHSNLFQRAILQSAALGEPPGTAAEARRVGRRFLEELGMSPASSDLASQLHSVPVAQILEAQRKVLMSEAGGPVPFRPFTDGDLLPEDVLTRYPEAVAGQVELMVGLTREEGAARLVIDPRMRSADAKMLHDSLSRYFTNPTAAAAVYSTLRPGANPAMMLIDAQTDLLVQWPTLRLAQAQAALGKKVFHYQFDWQSPQSELGACHCLELPFVFGTLDEFAHAPMLMNGNRVVMDALSMTMRRAWIAFARNGNPNHSGLGGWQPYEPQRRITMRFDTVCGPVGDLGGYGWRSPETESSLSLRPVS